MGLRSVENTGVLRLALIMTYGHTYAVNVILAGDDVKAVQSNMGHAAAAFTPDKYGHFAERMKQDSAARMERFLKDALDL